MGCLFINLTTKIRPLQYKVPILSDFFIAKNNTVPLSFRRLYKMSPKAQKALEKHGKKRKKIGYFASRYIYLLYYTIN